MPVYQYEGQHFDLPDGLSNEQAIAKIQSHLGTTKASKLDTTALFGEMEQKGQNWMKGLQGTAEAGASLLTGAAAMPLAPLVSGLSRLGGGEPIGVEQAMERMTYAPRTEIGQETTGRVGEALSHYVVPAAMGVQGLPYVNTLGPIAQSLAGRMTRAGKATPVEAVKGLSTALDELTGKTPAPTDTAFWKQRALQMEQDAQAAHAAEGQRPIIVGPEGVEMPGARSAQEAMAAFDRQVRQSERQAPTEGEGVLHVDEQGQVYREGRPEDAASEELARKLQKQQAAETARSEAQSGLAQRAGEGVQEEMFGAPELFDLQHAGEMPARETPPIPAPLTEQRGLFEPHTNMHRPYTEMFAKDEQGTRLFSLNEFKEIMNNLAKEEGTRFQMPEDINQAYTQYKERIKGGQQDFFGAHAVEAVPEHLPYGELSPQKRGAMTKKIKGGEQISEAMLNRMSGDKGLIHMRAGFTAEDMSLSTLLHKFGGPSPLNNMPGISERLKDIGNAMITTPELAIKLAKETPDVAQNALQRGVNALTKGGIYLKAKLNNPVVHFTVDRFLKAEGEAKAEISEKLHGVYLESLRQLTTKEYNEAFQLLNAADLSQRPLTSEFLAKHGFSDNLQNFIKVHQDMMTDTLGKINAAREAAGKKPIEAREAYSAMNMSGDFRKVAYKMVDGEKEVVGVIGANVLKETKKVFGKEVPDRFKTHSLERLEREMKEKDPEIQFGPLQNMSAANRSTKGTPHEAFMDVLNILGEDNPHIKEFLDTLREVAKDDPNNYMGMQKHTMQKKGVWGMEGRKPWLSAEENAKAFFENQVQYAESAYNWSGLAEAAKDVNDVIRNEDVIAKQKNAIGLSEQYMQNALGINPSKVGNAVTGLFNSLFSASGIGPSVPKAGIQYARMGANTALLSLNPAFLGIQLLQSPAALPALTSLLRGRGLASKATLLTMGFDHSTKAMIALGKMVTGKGELSAVERGALDYAQKNHIYATDLVEHTSQTQKGAAYYATKMTQTPAAKIEAGTRAHMFMTVVSMMDEAGLKPKDGLYEQAQRMTDMAMNHYGAIEKPPVYHTLGPLGSMAYNLRSYGHNEISRWALYAREIGKTGNPVPLLTQMATTIALAGVMGLPFFSQWETIYDFITKKLGKPRSLALDVMTASQEVGKSLGPKGAFALSNGLPSLAGMDLSKRTGLGDVLPSSASDAAFAGSGKLAQMGKSVYDVATNPSEETAKAAAINFAPPALQGPMDVAWYQKGNLAFSKDPTKLRPVAERNEADILLKKIGLTGINESTQKQKVYQQGQLDKAYQDYRTSAMNTIAQDLFRDRPIAKTTIDKYFTTGQGDPSTFEADLNKMALQQNMSPQQYAILRQSASQQIPQLRSLQRRMQ